MPHIKCNDFCSTALEQHLRKPAGRGADIKSRTPGDTDVETIESGDEFVRSSRYIVIGSINCDVVRFLNFERCFSHGFSIYPDKTRRDERSRVRSRASQATFS